MNKIRHTILLSGLLSLPISGFSAEVIIPPGSNAPASTNNVFGVWGSVTLKGDFKAVSPSLDKFHWQIMNQTRTRDDSDQGTRFTENLLFTQIGYQLNKHASIWLGYVHDWIAPLNKTTLNENRIYQDFVWKQSFGEFNFTSRTRMDERMHLRTGGPNAYRPRQLLKISHALPFADGLSAYIGDEVLFYLNKNHFGKQGFSENRIFTGLSYQANQKVGLKLGYMGQYVDTISGSNLFTHNIQADISYKF
ncbi:DUF2490 domain-containing protein [methanotrophic endosymbiont of Bathymodiolus puteoserpentis (Logatchev)]|jgi:hypothetical protein|uniref:DUF2490 domain-containing protein n=1 Tax=methanotrophic endosymbiont of Bathymodiolus puteoserpentis (Logatchev) TaxID=343235 RepID=UPI0013CD9551|nr:DUF2490 domain-containing protein [methanotrophic endosymbiont of Bathymodiolus puteoserpentis (Logatchev)]SHE21994.1 hypothetical protein BPUTEOMOX_84 [methanotrophic endosymbiont of Bathymodiolus puteoserpentis (Logatchev)]